MKHLWLASIFFYLLFSSCVPRFNMGKSGEPSTSQPAASVYLYWQESDTALSAYKFKTFVNVYGKKVDGILFLRKMSNELYRATFLAKGSLKLFDMELTPDTFIVRDHAKQLSNPAALRTLAYDMHVLTFGLHQTFSAADATEDKKTDSYTVKKTEKDELLFFTWQAKQLKQLVVTDARRKKKVILDISEYQGQTPTKISIQHARFRMHIDLTLLE